MEINHSIALLIVGSIFIGAGIGILLPNKGTFYGILFIIMGFIFQLISLIQNKEVKDNE